MEQKEEGVVFFPGEAHFSGRNQELPIPRDDYATQQSIYDRIFGLFKSQSQKEEFHNFVCSLGVNKKEKGRKLPLSQDVQKEAAEHSAPQEVYAGQEQQVLEQPALKRHRASRGQGDVGRVQVSQRNASFGRLEE